MRRAIASLVLPLLLLSFGCGKGSPPAASITTAPKATPEMQAATTWLIGGWNGKVEIDRAAVLRTNGLTEEHVKGVESAGMQFRFQDNGRVAMSVTVPTPRGPAARNAMADFSVTKVQGPEVTIRIAHRDDQPTEEVVVTRGGNDEFTIPAPQNLGTVRFHRTP